MTYEKRLLLSKAIISLTALLVAWPLVSGGDYDRGVVFWTNSLPVFAYIMWGDLHGTGRSVRLVGLLGLAYAASLAITGSVYEPAFLAVLLTGFTAGSLLSVKTVGQMVTPALN